MRQLQKSSLTMTFSYPLHFSIRFLFPLWRISLFLGICNLSADILRTWPPLWSSDQSSWLQIQRSGFDFRSYQIFWEIVSLRPQNWSTHSSTLTQVLVMLYLPEKSPSTQCVRDWGASQNRNQIPEHEPHSSPWNITPSRGPQLLPFIQNLIGRQAYCFIGDKFVCARRRRRIGRREA
jgi:hypothetical protein